MAKHELSTDEKIGLLKTQFYNESEALPFSEPKEWRRHMRRIDSLLDAWLELTGVEVVLVDDSDNIGIVAE